MKITGKNYATGQRVPSWVKLRTHTVAKVEPSRALLKEINSWVARLETRGETVRLGRERCFYKARCGLRRLHLGARKARAGFPALAEKHTVTKVQQNRGTLEALLGDISSWVAVGSLEEV